MHDALTAMGIIWIYICILIPCTERLPKGGLRLIQVSLYGLLGGAEEVSALWDAVAFDLAKDIDASERLGEKASRCVVSITSSASV